jgi:hypothetical protein
MDGTAMTAPWHFGMRYAGKTLDWLPTDTRESYERMVQNPAHREYFAQKGWDQPGAITYRINSNGFRCKEFDENVPSIVALGCSYSIGIGLPLESIWPTLVGNVLGLEVWNLSWAGTSADTCFMQAQYWIPKLKPKLVVMAAPPKHRVDIITENPSLPHETYMPGMVNTITDNAIKQWLTNDRNADLNNARNKLAVKGLCAELKIECLTYDAHDFFARSREEVEYARDYMHAGPLGHKMFSERIINDWRKKHA